MNRADAQFADFAVGDFVTFRRKFTRADFSAFAQLSGDRNPLHGDAAYAKKTAFGRTIVPLHLLALPLSAVAGMMIPGHRALYLGAEMRALQPVAFGEELTYSARVASLHEAQRTLTLNTIAFRGSTVHFEATSRVRVRDDVPAGAWRDTGPEVRAARSARTAWITGATGHIGRAIALRLAAAGWNLVLLYRRDAAAAKSLAAACTAAGARATVLKADLESSEATAKAITSLPEGCALVHAASPPVQASAASLLAVNCSALMSLADAALPHMLARQNGRILLVGSSAVQYAPAGWDAYVAAKAAASTVVETLHRRYAPYGVRAVTLAPGFVMTPFSEGLRAQSGPALMADEVAEQACALLESDADTDTYVWMEPQSLQRGRFGYHSGKAPARAAPPTLPGAPGAHEALAPDATAALDEALRGFFRLSADADLDGAGLNLTPGWDSLRHIELMLHLESLLGLRFTTAEVERTVRYAELKRLVDEKRQ